MDLGTVVVAVVVVAVDRPTVSMRCFHDPHLAEEVQEEMEAKAALAQVGVGVAVQATKPI